MWKNGQNETEHSTWMQLLTGKSVHQRWSGTIRLEDEAERSCVIRINKIRVALLVSVNHVVFRCEFSFLFVLFSNQPGQLSLPSLRVSKRVLIHVITWINTLLLTRRDGRLS